MNYIEKLQAIEKKLAQDNCQQYKDRIQDRDRTIDQKELELSQLRKQLEDANNALLLARQVLKIDSIPVTHPIANPTVNNSFWGWLAGKFGFNGQPTAKS